MGGVEVLCELALMDIKTTWFCFLGYFYLVTWFCFIYLVFYLVLPGFAFWEIFGHLGLYFQASGLNLWCLSFLFLRCFQGLVGSVFFLVSGFATKFI